MTDIAANLDAARDRLQARRPYLTIEEAADLARCSPDTIRRAVRSRGLPSIRPFERLLFVEADLREWIESRPAVRENARPRCQVKRRQVAGSVAVLKGMDPELGR